MHTYSLLPHCPLSLGHSLTSIYLSDSLSLAIPPYRFLLLPFSSTFYSSRHPLSSLPALQDANGLSWTRPRNAWPGRAHSHPDRPERTQETRQRTHPFLSDLNQRCNQIPPFHSSDAIERYLHNSVVGSLFPLLSTFFLLRFNALYFCSFPSLSSSVCILFVFSFFLL